MSPRAVATLAEEPVQSFSAAAKNPGDAESLKKLEEISAQMKPKIPPAQGGSLP